MHNAQTGNEIEKYEKPELKECGTIKENTHAGENVNYDGETWS